MAQVEANVRIDHKIGEFLLPQFRDAKKRLWIMSPWISEEYMELALGKKVAGVDVRVMTSNDYVPGQKEAISKLIESHQRVARPERKDLKYTGIGLVVGGLVLIPVTAGVSLIISFVGLVLFLLGRESQQTYWVSKLGDGNLKIFESSPYKSVHAKVYIADDFIAIGSANLTGNGTKRNIEGMVSMYGEELATQVCEMMSGISQNLNLREVPYDTLGRDVQRVEPRRRHYRRHSARY